jgi:hypothetical protein
MSNDELMGNDEASRKENRRCSFIIRSFWLPSDFVISSRVSHYFLDGCVAGEDAAQAVLAQCHHS